MTKWMHKCSLEWLKARQVCLTATDVKDLLPVTKTGRKRTIGDEDYLKVMSRKMVNLTEGDCTSVGAAARGHILEPYAIDAFNCMMTPSLSDQLYHWDDVVLTKPNHVKFGLSFSPDATNVSAIGNEVMQEVVPSITSIGEVKSYSAEKILIYGYSNKMELEERWQIATAMAVSPDIEDAYLILYNPSMDRGLFIIDYDRSDLQSEIEIIEQVESDWLNWVCNVFPNLDHHLRVTVPSKTEGQIIAEIIKSEELNPEGEKSVIR